MKEVNPLKVLRTSARLTMVDVANQAEVSRQYVIRAEQGVFASCPAILVEVLANHLHELDYVTIAAQYENWQMLRRKESYGSLSPNFDFHLHIGFDNLNPHPLTHWREHSGITARIQISKLFCVHPALIFKFEEQPWLVTNPPGELMTGLRQAGYTEDMLNHFSEAYALFRKVRRD